MLRLAGLLLLVLVVATGAACSRGDGVIDLRSSAFRDRGTIPETYSCDGSNLSPPLSWSDVPAGTKELALVMADFDAEGGIFHHWVVTGIPADVRSIAAGRLPAGAVTALTTSGNAGYVGPCPPQGERHEYVLTVFALKKRLGLPEGTPTKEALDAIDGARLGGEGELRGELGR